MKCKYFVHLVNFDNLSQNKIEENTKEKEGEMRVNEKFNLGKLH